MRPAKPLTTVLTAATLFGLGAGGVWFTSRLGHPPAEGLPAPEGVVIFSATHYRTKGPCIQIGESLAMPIIEGFEVLGVDRGELPAKRVQVRPLTGSGHLDGLGDGEACVLRLIPSQETREQLRGDGKEAIGVLWVDGSELEVQQPAK